VITDAAFSAGAAVFAGLAAGFAAGVLAVVVCRHRPHRHELEPLEPLELEGAPRLVSSYPRRAVEVVPSFHDAEHEGWITPPGGEPLSTPAP
jgi:hypothetical protein